MSTKLLFQILIALITVVVFVTKKQTVTKALEEFIDRRRQRRVLKAFGTFQFRQEWDYKQDRFGREPRR